MPPLPRFAPVPPGHIFQKVAMPLVAHFSDGELYVGGTAFMIGKQLALTATHNLEEFARRGGLKFPESGQAEVNTYKILAYLADSNGECRLPMRILKSWQSPRFDVAVLILATPPNWPETVTWTLPRIDLLPPKVGTQVAAFGYTKGIISTSQGPSGSIGFESHIASGTVTKIHHSYRDRVILPFPCFETTARFEFGMSGGPVIDQNSGDVCGVVCNGWSNMDERGDYLSHASTLWPVAGLSVDCSTQVFTGEPTRPLIETFDEFHVTVSNSDKIEVCPVPLVGAIIEAKYPFAEWDAGISAS